MFKKQIATAILLVAGLFSSSYLFSQNEDKTLDPNDPNDYGGICCDATCSACWHPNEIIFINASWYSGGPYCP